jgi:hypothetical protein
MCGWLRLEIDALFSMHPSCFPLSFTLAGHVNGPRSSAPRAQRGAWCEAGQRVVVMRAPGATAARAQTRARPQALGVAADLGPAGVGRCLREVGLGFMFASRFNPALAAVNPTRKALRVRTAFNLLGPLLNPAATPFSLVGVYAPGVAPLMADVLRALGSRRALVVHSAGLDELTPMAPADVVEVTQASRRAYRRAARPVPTLTLPYRRTTRPPAPLSSGALPGCGRACRAHPGRETPRRRPPRRRSAHMPARRPLPLPAAAERPGGRPRRAACGERGPRLRRAPAPCAQAGPAAPGHPAVHGGGPGRRRRGGQRGHPARRVRRRALGRRGRAQPERGRRAGGGRARAERRGRRRACAGAPPVPDRGALCERAGAAAARGPPVVAAD